MNSPISQNLEQVSERVATWTDNAYKAVSIGIDRAGGGCGYLGYQVASYTVSGTVKVGQGLYFVGDEILKDGAFKTAHFIKRNWPKLLAYLAGWAVIVVCAGFMNGYKAGGLGGIVQGFKAVSLPLSIGMGCGVIFGGICGIFVVGVFNKKTNPHSEDPIEREKRPYKPELTTAWGYLNNWISKISDVGTKAMMISISVAVIMALAARFPHAAGGVFGVFIGWQIVCKIGYEMDLGTDPVHEKTVKELLDEAKKHRDMSDQLLEQLEKKVKKDDVP